MQTLSPISPGSLSRSALSPESHRFKPRNSKPKGSVMQPSQPKPCAECGDTFFTERMLNMHRRVHHERLPSFLCPHCNGPYGKVTELNAHILSDHGEEKRRRKCEECVCTFGTEFQLRQHVQMAHRREVLKCGECEFVSIYNGLLKRHREVEHGIKEEVKVRENDTRDEADNVSYDEARKTTIGHIVVPRDV